LEHGSLSCVSGIVLCSYAMSEWGWNEKEKHEEMTDPLAWYLIGYDEDADSRPVAAVHFRFDIDADEEVLYWYWLFIIIIIITIF